MSIEVGAVKQAGAVMDLLGVVEQKARSLEEVYNQLVERLKVVTNEVPMPPSGVRGLSGGSPGGSPAARRLVEVGQALGRLGEAMQNLLSNLEV